MEILFVLALLVFGATILCDAGRAIATNLVSGLGGTVPKYIGWGTGAGTAAVTDTTLFTEAAETRATGTPTRVTTSVTNDTFQVAGTMTVAGAGKTITNAGTFDAVSSGNMFIKGDFTGIALNVGDSISFSIRWQLS